MWINVLFVEEKNYVWGYCEGKVVYVLLGVLDVEIYGVKLIIEDMVCWV